MKQAIRWYVPAAFAAVAALWGSSPAAAQDLGSAEGADAPAEGAEASPALDPQEAALEPAGQEVEPSAGDKWARWSARYIDRPRTLPRQLVEVGGYLDLTRVGGDAAVTTVGLVGAAAYGVSDQLEVRASYGLTLDEFEAKGPLSVGAAFGLAEGALAIAVTGDLLYDLNTEVGEIGVGARVRYLLSPNFALYSQRQLLVTVISDYDLKPANLILPIGVGFQLNAQLYLFGETELASLDLKDSETVALFADYIPLTAGAVFTLSKKFEVGGLLYTDLKNDAFDTLLIEGFARAYF